MAYEHLIVERRGAADWVTLNRPEQLNTLNPLLLRELNDYFGALERNYAVRVVVLRGAGRAFCAGLDMKATGSTPLDAGSDAMLRSQREFSGLVMRMRRCPQPIIGLLHGHAAGGGFSIALGCEMGASYHLPRLVGSSVAAELLYTGRFIDAERALRVGLVSEVVPPEQLEAAGAALAADMLATAPLGLRLTKECFWAAVDGNDLPSVIAMEDRNQVLSVANGDLTEGIQAFLQKRRPNYAD
jgi:enoyl-CoA hydratase